jgi:hypothetical protein
MEYVLIERLNSYSETEKCENRLKFGLERHGMAIEPCRFSITDVPLNEFRVMDCGCTTRECVLGNSYLAIWGEMHKNVMPPHLDVAACLASSSWKR